MSSSLGPAPLTALATLFRAELTPDPVAGEERWRLLARIATPRPGDPALPVEPLIAALADGRGGSELLWLVAHRTPAAVKPHLMALMEAARAEAARLGALWTPLLDAAASPGHWVNPNPLAPAEPPPPETWPDLDAHLAAAAPVIQATEPTALLHHLRDFRAPALRRAVARHVARLDAELVAWLASDPAVAAETADNPHLPVSDRHALAAALVRYLEPARPGVSIPDRLRPTLARLAAHPAGLGAEMQAALTERLRQNSPAAAISPWRDPSREYPLAVARRVIEPTLLADPTLDATAVATLATTTTHLPALVAALDHPAATPDLRRRLMASHALSPALLRHLTARTPATALDALLDDLLAPPLREHPRALGRALVALWERADTPDAVRARLIDLTPESAELLTHFARRAPLRADPRIRAHLLAHATPDIAHRLLLDASVDEGDLLVAHIAHAPRLLLQLLAHGRLAHLDSIPAALIAPLIAAEPDIRLKAAVLARLAPAGDGRLRPQARPPAPTTPTPTAAPRRR